MAGLFKNTYYMNKGCKRPLEIPNFQFASRQD